MARMFLVVAGVVLALGPTAATVVAGQELRGSPQSVVAGSPAADTGRLNGVVTAADGSAIGDALLSLSGPGGSSLAVSDSAGRFRFEKLPAGRYLLRTHLTGIGTSPRFVQVESGQTVFEPVVLSPADESNPDLLLAGSTFQFGNASVEPVPGNARAGSSAEDPDRAQPGVASTPEDPGAVRPRPQDAKMWRLRRARRSVLKDRMTGASLVQRGATAPGSANAGSVVERWAAAGRGSLEHPLAGVAGLPISGEVQFLTRATLAGPSFLWPSEAWPGQVAYVSVAPSGTSDWALRGTVDMTTGETASWAIAGWYTVEPRQDHDVEVAVSYSRQVHAAAADLRLDGPGPVAAGVPRREVGRVEAADTWAVSPALEIGYGAELARYGYLEDGRLFSPQASVTMSPVDGTRVRAAVSRNMTAPGGEQFLPPLDGVWLPPERTYTSLSGLADLHAEQVRHVEIGLEHELGERSVIGVRRFSQEVDNQLMAMFAPGVHAPPGTLPASGGHYYMTGAGGVDVDGWGVTFDHELEERLRGAIDYRIVRSEWAPPGFAQGAELAAARPGSGMDYFQDVAATLQAEIPETSTRIVARCRVSTAFAQFTSGGVDPGLDARFDLQVTQTLPFAPFEGSSWELLVALRSLFHEPGQGASIYDELLVVDPPRQLVGGLVVHF